MQRLSNTPLDPEVSDTGHVILLYCPLVTPILAVLQDCTGGEECFLLISGLRRHWPSSHNLQLTKFLLQNIQGIRHYTLQGDKGRMESVKVSVLGGGEGGWGRAGGRPSHFLR